MSRPANTKRILEGRAGIEFDHVTFFVFGHTWFDGGIDESTVPAMWEQHREPFMKLWLTFEPFSYIGQEFTKNKPGTRPWSWWNDNPEYKRKIYNAKEFNYFDDKHSCGYPCGWSGNTGPVIETQAAFLKRKGLLIPAEIEYFENNEMEMKKTH